MARVAVAFVEIRPDMGKGATGFAGQLKAALNNLTAVHKVKITPDTKNFGNAVTNAVKKTEGAGGVGDEADALGQLIGEHASKHITDNWEVDRDKIMEPMGDVADSMNEIMALLGDEVDKEFVKAIKRRHSKRMVDAMQSNFDKVEREEKIRAQALAEQFADHYKRTLIGRNRDITHAEAANFKVQMLREFGPLGEAVADRTVKSFNAGLAKQRAAMAQEAKKLAADIEKAHAAAIKENEARTVQAAKDSARRVTDETVRETRRMGRLINEENDKNGRLAGKTFADRFAKEMRLGANLRLGQLLPLIIGISFAAAPLAGLLSDLAAGASAFAAALGEAAVAALAGFGAGLLSVYQSIGTVTFALQGMNDAMKAQDDILQRITAGLKITQSQLDKYTDSMRQLSPNARDVVVTLGLIERCLIAIRKAVSQKLFAGMAAELNALGKTYLPLLRTELSRTATMLNTAAKQFGGFLRSASTIKLVRTAMAGGTAIAERFTHALIPLADAALRLLVAVQPLAEQLAGYAVSWAKAVDASVRASEKSGRLTGIIGNLQRALEQAHTIIDNLWQGISATFSALLGPGRTLLDMFENLTARWKAWTRSIAGQNAIEQWGEVAIPIMSALGGLIGDLFRAFMRLSKVGEAGGFLQSLRGLVPPLEEFIKQLSASGAAQDFVDAMRDLLAALSAIEAGEAFASITRSVATFLQFVQWLVVSVPGLTGALSGLLRVLTFIAAVKFVTALTGLAKVPLYAGYILNFSNALRAAAVSEQVAATGAFRFGNLVRNLGIIIALTSKEVWNIVRALWASVAALVATRSGFVGAEIAARSFMAALAANPVGAIVIGVVALGAAVWGLYNAFTSATPAAVKFGDALGKAGNPAAQKSITDSIEELRKQVDYIRSFPEMPWSKKSRKEADDMAKAMEHLGIIGNNVSVWYGSQVDTMIKKLRERGLAESVTDAQIIEAMNNVKSHYANHVVTAEMMVNDLSNLFGIMVTNTDEAMTQVAGYVTNAANAYGNLSEAAVAAALKQVQAAAAAGDIYGGAGRLLGQQQAALKALQGTAPTYKPPKFDVPDIDFSGFVDTSSAAGSSAGKKTAAGFISNFNAALSKLNLLDLVAHSRKWTAVGLNIAKYLAKGITSGTTNINRVGAFIVKRFGGTVKKVQAIVEKYRQVSNPWIKELKKNLNTEGLNELLDQIRDFKKSAFDTLTSNRTLVNYFGFIPTPGEVQAQLDAQLANLKEFTNGLIALQKKGLDPELAKAWLLAGPETAGNLVKGLQDASPEQVAAMNKTFNQIGTTATSQTKAISDAAFGLGEAQVLGYIAGIKKNQDLAVKAFNDIVAAQIKAVKKALGIKSPSKVYDAIGSDTVDGFIQGIQSKQDATMAAIENLYGSVTKVVPPTLTPPAVPKYAAAGAVGTAASTTLQPSFDVRVFVGDRELTDIVQLQINQTDESSARDLLAGRRGG